MLFRDVAFRILLLVVGVVGGGGVWGQYVVDFEGSGETKGSYASGNVTLSGIEWNMTVALIGTDADDFKNGALLFRIRGRNGCKISIIADQTYVARTGSLKFSSLNTHDTRKKYIVENSIKGEGSCVFHLSNANRI